METMSWSDDMRCLFCDGKLPLYRKITHGQFCSTSHRKAYWQEQERLAVERLHQTHSSLRAAMPRASVESILGPPVQVETVLGGFVAPAQIYPQAQGAPWLLAADPLVYDMELIPGKPVWTRSEPAAQSLPGARVIDMAQVWFGASWFGSSCIPALELRGGDYLPRPVRLEPVSLLRLADQDELPVHLPPLGLPSSAGIAPAPIAPATAARPRNPLPSRMPRPTVRLNLAIAPVTPEIEHAPEPEAPIADRLFPLLRFGVREIAPTLKSAAEPLASLLSMVSHPQHRVVKAAYMAELARPLPLARVRAAASAGAQAEPRGAFTPFLAALLSTVSHPQHRVAKPTRRAELTRLLPLARFHAAAPAGAPAEPL
jgi:hypothetical protein